jgi:type II secretory pathway pseudopilin PulG
MKKKCFLLLEILISLSLLSILLTFLFHSMAQGIKMEERVEQARTILLARQRLQTRLQDLFLTVTPEHLPPIYTLVFPDEKKASLVVYFDHGIDPNPTFSGPVLGRIYLDEESNLVLAIWPLEKEKRNRPWRKEILLRHVTHFQFEFLGQRQKKEDVAVGNDLAWYQQWPKKRLEIPSMIRLAITQNKTKLLFAFFLTTSEPFITYWEGESPL